jgi:hypothetical protein
MLSSSSLFREVYCRITFIKCSCKNKPINFMFYTVVRNTYWLYKIWVQCKRRRWVRRSSVDCDVRCNHQTCHCYVSLNLVILKVSLRCIAKFCGGKAVSTLQLHVYNYTTSSELCWWTVLWIIGHFCGFFGTISFKKILPVSRSSVYCVFFSLGSNLNLTPRAHWISITHRWK